MKGMCENYDLTMPPSVECLCRNELPNGRKGEKQMEKGRGKGEKGNEGGGGKERGEEKRGEGGRGEERVEGTTCKRVKRRKNENRSKGNRWERRKEYNHIAVT